MRTERWDAAAALWDAKAERLENGWCPTCGNPRPECVALIRDAVLHERGPLEGMGLTNDQINAVLAVIDDAKPEYHHASA